MSKEAALLNALTATLLDSIAGYQKSASEVTGRQVAETFLARARERRWAVTKLQAAVALEGGTPESESALLAGAHRAFLRFHAPGEPRGDEAVVADLERGEDYLRGQFAAALARQDLTETARRAVAEAWRSVEAGHAEMAALKRALGVD